MTGPRSKRR